MTNTTLNPADLPPLREVIARYQLSARYELAQHFLLDLNLCGRIARTAGNLTRTNVIEIGPGPGGLTRSLLEAGARQVIAVERDRRCIAAIKDVAAAYPGRLQVVEADAMELNLATVCPAPRRIVANLPYNISTALLIGWLKQVDDFESMTCMFQREVADRLAAGTGSKAYGRLSVITQWLCTISHEFNVDRRAFTPPPKVASSVVTITPRPAPLAPADRATLEKVTAAAFGQRRKMLRASLKQLKLETPLDELGIDPTARAENLTVEEFCVLARALYEQLMPRCAPKPIPRNPAHETRISKEKT